MAEEKKKHGILKVVLVVIVIAVAAGVVGSMGGGSAPSSGDAGDAAGAAAPQAETQPQESYTITDEAADTSNPYSYVITGTLTNNTDQDKSYIQVQYNLYDASGAQIGTALANTNNLKAGGTWKFEALGTSDPSQVASWERMDVTGF